ncbi:MAG: tetratricopeptide repeat protein [Candidatus Nitronauta litoralis]|uniref:Tetratricopeptide repeat protein n=1 Tax=Candidatus Nitronauta litoralis TaxID=2705533 RepID=A0A7T0BUB3_9BACT|nr:MAG: tetratricopeptide repeat protein [Candidatus Nitronauta litoralis]
MPKIYLSYREGEAPELVDQVVRHLSICFGESEILGSGSEDATIPLQDVLKEILNQCAAMVVLMGPNWSKGAEPGSAGLRDPKDPVRLEIEVGLGLGLLIVPVPFDNAPQPGMQSLPQSLVDFLRQPPVRLDPANTQSGLAELTKRLETGLALQHVIRNSTLKRGSIHHRELPEEDLLGFTDENRPEDIFGIEHSTLTDIRRAIDYQETALNLARESKDQEAESRALGKLGLAFGKIGESSRAIDCFEKQLRILKELGKREELGDLLANLGDASAVQLDFSRAVSYYNEQLGLSLELGDRDMEAAAQVGLGHCYIKMEDFERGVKFYERAYARIRETGDSGEQARLLVGLGLNYRKLGRAAEALDPLKQALELARRLGDRREEVFILEDIADTYRDLGEPDLFLGFRENQLEVARDLDDAPLEAQILMDIARDYHGRGEIKAALARAEQASTRVYLIDSAMHRRICEQIDSWKEPT